MEILPSPYDVFGSGTHQFTATNTQITAKGLGAFIGFNKAFNGTELAEDGTTSRASEIIYHVFDYTAVGTTERLTITVDFDGRFWTMRLISEN